MHLGDYQAKIEYDDELGLFRGEILGLNGGADFYGQNPDELRQEFAQSLKVFLEVCQEKGISPTRPKVTLANKGFRISRKRDGTLVAIVHRRRHHQSTKNIL
jgi:predicted HicB family RNase H-like nuclease